MAKVNDKPSASSRKIRPALNPDAREQQLISLAIDLVEKRLIEGTASSQETTHFLKLATSKARIEKEMMEKQMELMDAKTKQIRSEENREALFKQAIEAMRKYQGRGGEVDDEEGDY